MQNKFFSANKANQRIQKIQANGIYANNQILTTKITVVKKLKTE